MTYKPPAIPSNLQCAGGQLLQDEQHTSHDDKVKDQRGGCGQHMRRGAVRCGAVRCGAVRAEGAGELRNDPGRSGCAGSR